MTTALQFLSIDDAAGQALLLVMGQPIAFARTKASASFECRVNGLRHYAGMTKWEPLSNAICPIGDMGMTVLRYN